MKERIRITLLMLVAFLCVPTLLAADPEWEYIYEGDILPDDASLADKAWQLMGDNQFAEVTGRGELHINDIGQNHCFFLYNVTDAGLMQQATIEARVKVLSQSGSANFEVLVGMQDGSNSKWLDLFPDHILLDSSSSTYDIDMTEYHILRMVRDSANIRIYVDDEEVMNQDHTGAGESWIGFIFGAGATLSKSEQYWDYVVFTTEGGYSPDELPSYASIRGNTGTAYGPKPVNGSLYSDTWINLSWRPGPFAVSHDVYIGENFEDVNNGTGDTFRGNTALAYFVVGFPGYPYPDGLIPGTTYYWRIDEVNEADPNSPWKGNVWSFSIPPKTAYYPNPADSAELVDLDIRLSWTAGFGAKLHYIVFGEDYDEVNNVAMGVPNGTTTYSPGALKLARTYYWRVDEFDGVETHKGEVWSFTTLGAANNPNPANRAVDVKPSVILTWDAGSVAASHEVYFGTHADAVRNATAASPEYKGPKALGEESYNPGKLEFNSTYYWRIEEVNDASTDSPWPGKVWSFTTGDFFVIDDFEDYDAGINQIWYAWHDGLGYGAPGTDPYYAGNGTGAALGDENSPSYTEETIVHVGGKSMPVSYDNNKQGFAYYSEVEHTLTDQRDWTDRGVGSLSIWFRGRSDNIAEPLYVAVSNRTGTPAIVVHGDPAAAQIDTWTEWVIPLSALADQGINLTDIDRIAIGLGTRGNMTIPGGSGKMYFDDIRLYQSREAAEYLASHYFPLNINNFWQYHCIITPEGESTYEEYTYKYVAGMEMFNDIYSYRVKEDIDSIEDENESFYYSVTADGVFYVGVSDPDADDEGHSEALLLTPPILFLRSSFCPGDTWSTTSEAVDVIDDVVDSAWPIEYVYDVSESAPVTTPAGMFQDCIRIVEQVYDEEGPIEQTTLWLARGIGLIREEHYSPDSSHTKELQYYSVNGVTGGTEI